MSEIGWRPSKLDYLRVWAKKLGEVFLLAFGVFVVPFVAFPFGIAYFISTRVQLQHPSIACIPLVVIALCVVAYNLIGGLYRRGVYKRISKEPLEVRPASSDDYTRRFWEYDLGLRIYNASEVITSLLVSYLAVAASIFTCQAFGWSPARDESMVSMVDIFRLLGWHAMSIVPLLNR